MKPKLLLLLAAAAAVNTAYAQRVDDPKSDAPREPIQRIYNYSDLSSMPVSSKTTIAVETLRMRYGAFGSLNLNHHPADFHTLPGIPNCCSQFAEGNGTGGSFGGLIEIPIASNMIIGVRAGVTSNIARLQTDEHTVVFVDTAAVPARFQHTIDAAPMNLGITPMFGYRLAAGLWLQGGTELGYMIKRHYSQNERLIEPSVGQFSDGKRTRNEFSGDIPKANLFQSTLLFGAGYDLPLNRRHTMYAAPELFYAVGLTDLVEGLDWKANALRLGMAIKYSPWPAGLEPKIEEPRTGILAAGLEAVQVQRDGNEAPLSTLNIEQIISYSMRPLLNYVFFDENSAQIPVRYNKLSPYETETFRPEGLHQAETMSAYYQVLNVIGRRLRDNPDAAITLVGCNAGAGVERGNRDLSRRRAESIRNYLRDNWGIAERRMNIDTRDLPDNPSNTSDRDGLAENRRVEIRSNVPGIVDPLFTTDTLRRTEIPTVRFRPTVRSEAGVTDWTLSAVQNGRTLKSFHGTGDVPQNLDWNVGGEQVVPRGGAPVEYQLEVNDAIGQTTTTPIGTIDVDVLPEQAAQNRMGNYKELSRYSLILFDFNSADPNAQNKAIVGKLRERIAPNANISVTGYTDRIGDAEYNRKLSEARARRVAEILNAPNAAISGVGETMPIYDNDLPEGRYYNRTVDIVIENPIK